jgi:succinate dehydrogenase / fumarate reductase membrane anchor subunit
MATRATEQQTTTPYGATSRPGPGATGWETFTWWFMRVSGVALIFLAIIHLLVMHVINDVSATGYCFIAARYANPFWRVYDLLLLSLALLHGLNGLRIVTDDYIQRRVVRVGVQSVLFLVAITFFLMGTMTIITFRPPQGACPSITHVAQVAPATRAATSR